MVAIVVHKRPTSSNDHHHKTECAYLKVDRHIFYISIYKSEQLPRPMLRARAYLCAKSQNNTKYTHLSCVGGGHFAHR